MGIDWNKLNFKEHTETFAGGPDSEIQEKWAEAHLEQMMAKKQRKMIVTGKSAADRRGYALQVCSCMKNKGYNILEFYAEGLEGKDNESLKTQLEMVYDSAAAGKTVLLLHSVNKTEDKQASQMLAYVIDMIISDFEDSIVVVSESEIEEIPERITENAYICIPKRYDGIEAVELIKDMVSPHIIDGDAEKYIEGLVPQQIIIFAEMLKAYAKTSADSGKGIITAKELKKAQSDVLELQGTVKIPAAVQPIFMANGQSIPAASETENSVKPKNDSPNSLEKLADASDSDAFKKGLDAINASKHITEKDIIDELKQNGEYLEDNLAAKLGITHEDAEEYDYELFDY